MMDGMLPVYMVIVTLMDESVMGHDIAAANVFAAVDFVRDECAKNGWVPRGIEVLDKALAMASDEVNGAQLSLLQ